MQEYSLVIFSFFAEKLSGLSAEQKKSEDPEIYTILFLRFPFG